MGASGRKKQTLIGVKLFGALMLAIGIYLGFTWFSEFKKPILGLKQQTFIVDEIVGTEGFPESANTGRAYYLEKEMLFVADQNGHRHVYMFTVTKKTPFLNDGDKFPGYLTANGKIIDARKSEGSNILLGLSVFLTFVGTVAYLEGGISFRLQERKLKKRLKVTKREIIRG